jgi:hypothetical protein
MGLAIKVGQAVPPVHVAQAHEATSRRPVPQALPPALTNQFFGVPQ